MPTEVILYPVHYLTCFWWCYWREIVRFGGDLGYSVFRKDLFEVITEKCIGTNVGNRIAFIYSITSFRTIWWHLSNFVTKIIWKYILLIWIICLYRWLMHTRIFWIRSSWPMHQQFQMIIYSIIMCSSLACVGWVCICKFVCIDVWNIIIVYIMQ